MSEYKSRVSVSNIQRHLEAARDYNFKLKSELAYIDNILISFGY